MMRWIGLILLAVASTALVHGQQRRLAQAIAATRPPSPRFTYVDVYLDAKNQALAAYQFEFTAETGHATVVGIEGGDHPAFAKQPPYYDPSAIQQNRAIIAAFSLDKDLPKGRTRIARIHLMIEGDKPQYATKLQVAANADGKAIAGATLSLSEGVQP